jgi:hypothetical protein
MCPECAEQVRQAAMVCRFCYHRFADPAPALAAATAGPVPAAAPPGVAVGAASDPLAGRRPAPPPAVVAGVCAGIAATLLAVVAFGDLGSSPAPPATADHDDVVATAQARLAAAELESCWVDARSYDGCAGVVNVKRGTGGGEVELRRVAGDSYTLVSRAAGGHRFAVSHRAGDRPVRTCAPAGRGACGQDGTW